MPLCLIGAGSNLGDPEQRLNAARRALEGHPQIELRAASGFFATRPVGGPKGQPPFLNAAFLVETLLAPHALLECLHEIEASAGRQRARRWEARRLDLDLLLYDEQVLEDSRLSVPHPRMSFRRFVLQPAVEIAGQMRHPLIGWTLAELLNHLNSAPDYVAIASSSQADATRLAEQVASRTDAQLVRAPALGAPGGSESGLLAPAGYEISSDIEFARGSAAALRDAIGHSGPTISDFCLDADSARDDCGSFASPRLIVWLDLTVESHAADALQLPQSLAGRGPLLRLSQANRERWVDEVVAAIEAMR